MKTHLNIIIQIVFLLFLSHLSFSQEVEVNLGGNSTSDAFVVKDSSGNVLLKMDGDKNFGINSEQPDGIEIKGRAATGNQEVGDSIVIIGGNSGSDSGWKGGSVSIIGGNQGVAYNTAIGGSIYIAGGQGIHAGGHVNISGG
jgi:hypothetical protein